MMYCTSCGPLFEKGCTCLPYTEVNLVGIGKSSFPASGPQSKISDKNNTESGTPYMSRSELEERRYGDCHNIYHGKSDRTARG